jgi:hypothetical protein
MTDVYHEHEKILNALLVKLPVDTVNLINDLIFACIKVAEENKQ